VKRKWLKDTKTRKKHDSKKNERRRLMIMKTQGISIAKSLKLYKLMLLLLHTYIVVYHDTKTVENSSAFVNLVN